MERTDKATAPDSNPGRFDALDWRFVGGLVLGALLLRWIHVWTLRDTPYFAYLMLDPRMYDAWAQRIAAGEWVSARPFFQDPLYPYVLAVFYKFLGHHYTPVVLFQAFCGALAPGLLYIAARHHLGRSVAAVVGVASALYLPSIYYQGMVLKTWLAAFLVAVALTLLAYARVGGPRRLWLGAGVTLSLACLTRGNLVLFLPVVAAWVLLDAPWQERAPSWRERLTSRSAWTAAGWLLCGSASFLLLSAAHNLVGSGERVLATSNAGQNFYIGNNALNEKGQYTRLPFVDPNPKYEERDFAREATRRLGRELTATEVSRYWFSEATRWIRSHPGDWLTLTGKKIRNFWGAYELPDNLDYYLYRKTAPVLRLPLPGFGLVAPLGLLGAFMLWRRSGWPRLLILFVLTYSVSVVLFFVFSRFRMPMMPALFPLAGYAVVELFRVGREALQSRGRRDTVAAALLPLIIFSLLLAFVNLPVRGTQESFSVRLAAAIGAPRRLETTSNGHFNLGVSYAARAKEAASDAAEARALLGLAETELRAALAQEDRFAETYVELGKVLARQASSLPEPEARDRNLEAIELYASAAQLEPGDPRNHHAMGLLYSRIGDAVSAEQAYRQALSVEPRYVASSTRLAELLMEAQRFAEAENALENTLRHRPGDETAKRLLRQIQSRRNTNAP